MTLFGFVQLIATMWAVSLLVRFIPPRDESFQQSMDTYDSYLDCPGGDNWDL